MNKATRILASGLTSIVAIGVFAGPAAAADPGPLETSVCASLAAQVDSIGDAVDAGAIEWQEKVVEAEEAQTAMSAAGTDLGAAALSYIRAVDAGGNFNGPLGAVTDAAIDFSDSVTTFVDAVDALHEVSTSHYLQEAVLNYVSGICPPAPAPVS